MGQSGRPIRIRTLPRSNEKKTAMDTSEKSAKRAAKKAQLKHLSRTYVVVGVTTALTFAILFWDSPENHVSAIVKSDMGTTRRGGETPEDMVNTFLKESQIQRKMEMHNRELENKVTTKPLGKEDQIVEESDRTPGVSLEMENREQKVYEDIYGPEGKNRGPTSPDDRIKMRIEQEQWLSQTQKQERKVYIQNFLKEAYDAGYAIELDDNLVVTRVRKVTSKPSQTLDKVLENLARKGY